MAEPHRRIIIKPADLSDSTASLLNEHLAKAVEAQRELATRSPHVLQFTGALQQTDQAYYIEHEPASAAFTIPELFDPETEGADEKALLELASALFNTLETAHGGGGGLSAVHGGVCPGVILTSADGLLKVSDFGFAQAVCAVLGVDTYLNLAVGANPELPTEVQGTGIWQVLSPDEFERDDRLCAFVDPHKYGTMQLDTFEAGSDVIAAAFVLHLAAEHQHPYLHADPEAHRMVATSEFMAAAIYNGARRKDLRESTNPGVRLWCDLVGEMLARLPQERPSAKQLSERLGEFVKPPDAADMLLRQLDEIIERVEKTAPGDVAWAEETQAVDAIARSEIATEEIRQRARSFLAEANARVLLPKILELLDGDDWPSAKHPLDELLAIRGMPAELRKEAEQAGAALEHNLYAQRTLADIDARLQRLDGTDPQKAKSELDSLLAKMDQTRNDKALPATIQSEAERLHTAAGTWLGKITAELERIAARQREEAERLERERQEDYGKARAWMDDLESALAEKEWEFLATSLDDRPDITHWPEDVETKVGEVKSRLDEHLEEERRQEQIDADRRSALAWSEVLRGAVESEDWDGAESALASRPELTYWPDEILQEEERHSLRVRQYRQEQADRTQAFDWLGKLREAVQREAWNEAADVLARRPKLDYWPEEVLAEEPKYRGEIEKQLEALELERRRIEAERRQGQDWLQRVRDAAGKGEWQDALDILGSPPRIDNWPEDVPDQAEKLRVTCTQELERSRQQLRTELSQRVVREGREFLRAVISEHLGAALAPDCAEPNVSNIEFVNPKKPSGGTASLSLSFPNDVSQVAGSDFEHAFEFTIENGDPRILDDDSNLQTALVSHLSTVVAKLQETRVDDLAASLRKGMFPEATIDAVVDRLSENVPAVVSLCGPDIGEAKLQTEIAWDPATLHWRYSDQAKVAQHAVDIATKAARKVSGGGLLERSPELRRYRSLLALEIVALPPDDLDVVPDSLKLKGHLTIRPGENAQTQSLHTISIRSPQVGHVSAEADLQPAELVLRQLVVAAQNDARNTLREELTASVKQSKPKTRLTALPRRIKDPEDEIRFELKRRGFAPATLIADWHVEKFTYVPSKEWSEALDGILAASPPEGVRKRGVAAAATIGAAAVTILAGAGYVLMGGNGNRTPAPGGDSSPGRTPPVVREDDCEGVRAWIERVQEAVDSAECDTAEDIHAQRPDLTCRLEEEQELVEGIADCRQATVWIEEVSGAAAREDWDAAQSALADKPELANWPSQVRHQEHQLAQQVREALQTQADAALATAWLNELRDAVQREAWNEAVSALGRRPTIVAAHWPADVLAEESHLRSVVEDRPPVPTPSLDQAIATVREVLATSTHLEPFVARLVRGTNIGTADEPAISYRLPGLNNPSRIVELESRDTEGNWILSADQHGEIENAVADVDNILSVSGSRPLLELLPEALTDQPAGLIDGRKLRLVVDRPPEWALADNEWSAEEVSARVAYDLGSTDEVHIADLLLPLRAAGGAISVGDPASDVVESLTQQLEQVLRQRQTASLQARIDELSQRLASGLPPSEPTTPDPAVLLDGLRTDEVDVAIGLPDMQPRTFFVEWEPESLTFALGPVWEQKARKIIWYRDLLRELGEALDSDHWIARGSQGRFFEVAIPDTSTWTIAVTVPWVESAETAADDIALQLPIAVDSSRLNWADDDPAELAVQLLEQIERPAYWPLVEEYTSLTSGNPFFLAGFPLNEMAALAGGATLDADVRDRFTREVLPFWRSLPAIGPRMQSVSGDPDVSATSEGPTALSMSFNGSWGLAEDSERFPASISAGGLDTLRVAIAPSTAPATCTVRSSVDSTGKIARSWSNTGELLSHYVSTLPTTEALSERLSTLDARRNLDAALAQRFDVPPASGVDGASVQLDQAAAFDLLQEMWNIKKSATPATGDLLALTTKLQTDLGKNRQLSGKRDVIVPTVFVEYFLGPVSAYAIVFSAEPRASSIAEGPTLVRLCSSDSLINADQNQLGSILFDSVLNAAPEAVRARMGSNFDKQLGLVFAMDDWMSLPNPVNLPFQPRQTFLRPGAAMQARGGRQGYVNWQSLAGLESGDLRERVCGYKLLSSLADSGAVWSPYAPEQLEAQRSAAQTIHQALQASP
ncbi:MAG: hypothetical protein JSU63_18285 [Phycisphaerales bacterium]|nr:MAG: hypothetical protein JSU63_18285 [Phycisphaerales bacterium]